MADMVKRSMGETVPLRDRITMQSASLEVNRVLCMLASRAAGHHIEEIMQARGPHLGCPSIAAVSDVSRCGHACPLVSARVNFCSPLHSEQLTICRHVLK